jgi:hypothetical protein
MRIKMTEEEYLQHNDAGDGVCLACGEIKEGGVEPDAEYYNCNACGENQVCGVEHALIMSLLDIV